MASIDITVLILTIVMIGVTGFIVGPDMIEIISELLVESLDNWRRFFKGGK